MREKIIRDWFQAWIDADISAVRRTFTEDAVYTECYGPEYRGIEQIEKWFADWNKKGRVLEWKIGRMFECGESVIAQWYFKCDYEGEVSGFDGVTIADFDGSLISRLCEFQSKSEHVHPYGI